MTAIDFGILVSSGLRSTGFSRSLQRNDHRVARRATDDDDDDDEAEMIC